MRTPLDLLLEPDDRVFLPFLTSAALVAALVWVFRVRGHGVTLRRYLFPPHFGHRSARLDYALLVVRGLVRASGAVGRLVGAVGVAVAVARLLRLNFGTTSLRPTAVPLLFTVAAFVADDFTRYVVHRAMHRVDALWQLHQVHHSAEVLTPFTLHRVHPLESLFMSIRGVFTLGVVTGVFMWLFPGKVRGYWVLGVDVVGFALAAAGANLRHSHVWLSYGRWLERLLISPAQHQIHHSRDPADHDRNFGAGLAVWDALFGTLRLAGAYRKLSFGLARRNHRDTLGSALVDPLRAMFGRRSVVDGAGEPDAERRRERPGLVP